MKTWFVLLAFLLGLVVFFIPVMKENDRAHRCLVMVTIVTTLWVTEALPFFVSGMIGTLLIVLMGILADANGNEMSAEDAAKAAFSHYTDDTIFLVLGGFAISIAFSKCQFELRMASFIQQNFGHRCDFL